ncbi:hypothetical protein [uncultured Winogradskyella sp.]|uniref:hypothetical protein n=1 Tax=uncultured Winogradskyella sp. TaxID=395353 RepID=UPI00261EA1D2|nr:hypothetical protein [uncultured Winogradskyella sp.]
MKKFIYNTNQYLLERFPTIWNTRLAWMLLIALMLHVIFFMFGFITLTNPETLHERSIISIFFKNGTVFLSIIISILLLVVWLIYMFKNNGFKNFYPTSGSKLFGQFFAYAIIIFSCSTFYLSYQYGLKTYIASTYNDAQINKEIEIANDAALFFSENVSDYTIDNRRYPKPFYELYCEKLNEFIDFDEAYLEFGDKYYQFYSLYTKEVPLTDRYSYAYQNTIDNSDSTNFKLVYSKIKDTLRVLYFKDTVVNVKPFIKTAKPSYYNASSTFFISRHDALIVDHYNFNHQLYSEYDDYSYNYNPKYSIRHQLRNKRNYELLERNDKDEIKKLLEDFLKFSNYYKIPNNITADQWFNLVYNPGNFEVRSFIRTIPKTKYEYETAISLEQTKYEKFYTDYVTDYHLEHNKLSNVFENIEEIKASNPFMESIHFFMWLTFFLACVIFMFRITGLKPLLFSVLTIGVLALFISLLTALLFYIMRDYDDIISYFILYIVLIISLIILAIPIFFIETTKKLIVAICLNISILGFPLLLFLIIGIISMHQEEACRNSLDYSLGNYKCDTLIESLGFNWSYVLFALGIIFIFFYSKNIKKWKSLPEG